MNACDGPLRVFLDTNVVTAYGVSSDVFGAAGVGGRAGGRLGAWPASVRAGTPGAGRCFGRTCPLTVSAYMCHTCGRILYDYFGPGTRR